MIILLGYVKSRISLFLPLDWIETDKGFTTKGADKHSSTEPDEINSVIALSTKLLWAKADLLFLKW